MVTEPEAAGDVVELTETVEITEPDDEIVDLTDMVTEPEAAGDVVELTEEIEAPVAEAEVVDLNQAADSAAAEPEIIDLGDALENAAASEGAEPAGIKEPVGTEDEVIDLAETFGAAKPASAPAEVDEPVEADGSEAADTEQAGPEAETGPDEDTENMAQLVSLDEDDFDNEFEETYEGDDNFTDSLGMAIDDTVEDDGQDEATVEPRESEPAVVESGSADSAAETITIDPDQLEAALEKAVEKAFSGRIEKILVNIVEKTVRDEITRLRDLLMDDE